MDLILMEWIDELSVGIKEIDEQHKKLVALINKLTMALIQESEKEIIEHVIDELFNYTHTHFSYEERLFEQINYSQKKEHIKEHAEFEIRVKSSFAQLVAGTPEVAKELNRFLMDWLIKHIMVSDANYAEDFKKHGIQ